MNFDHVQQIADAVLYEGYLLYPYRQTSVKNQQLWTFSGVYPEAYSAAQRGTDACVMQTECIVTGSDDVRVTVRVRFLHLVERTVGALPHPVSAQANDSEYPYQLVDELPVGDRVYRPWKEAVERSVDAEVSLEDAIAAPMRVPIQFPALREIEPLHDAANSEVGVLIRIQQAINGMVTVGAEWLGDGIHKLSVRIANQSTLTTSDPSSRDAALPLTFISTHTIIGVVGGQFVSLIDPPTGMETIIAGCKHIGTWPVLAGEEGDWSMLLSSPIILYDYPKIAPESATNLFDGTEIDEILTLRIMTLTDDEKREIQQSDTRGRDLLARTEAIPEEQFRKMHGVIRGLPPRDGDTQ